MRKGLRQAMIVLGICMCLGGCEKETEAKTEPEGETVQSEDGDFFPESYSEETEKVILDLSKIEAGQLDFTFSNINVSSLFTTLAQTFKSRTKEEVTLECSPPVHPCFIYSEKTRLTQVITNFLTNACKFTFRGTIRMGYEEIEGGLRFYVSDTGKGISKENLPHVFERFAKFDNFIQGTGLGLSICLTIVKRLNGEIGVESEEGKGSTFWFTIPCEVHHKDIVISESRQ